MALSLEQCGCGSVGLSATAEPTSTQIVASVARLGRRVGQRRDGACALIFEAWRNDPRNAAQVRCLTPADLQKISKICIQTRVTSVISAAQGLQMIRRQIQAACARQARSGLAALNGLADVRPTVLIEENGRLVPKPVRPYAQPVVLRAGTRAAEIARLMR